MINGRVYDAETMHEIGNYDRGRPPFYWERPGHSDAFVWKGPVAGFAPATGSATFELGQLVVVAAWGLLGFAVALRRFRWEPHG